MDAILSEVGRELQME